MCFRCVCGSGERCRLRVIHPNLISPLALTPLGASCPLTASPQDDEPAGCFSPPSVPWRSGILGKSRPSPAVAAHLPPTLQPGAACCLLPLILPCGVTSPPRGARPSRPRLLGIPAHLPTAWKEPGQTDPEPAPAPALGVTPVPPGSDPKPRCLPRAPSARRGRSPDLQPWKRISWGRTSPKGGGEHLHPPRTAFPAQDWC